MATNHASRPGNSLPFPEKKRPAGRLVVGFKTVTAYFPDGEVEVLPLPYPESEPDELPDDGSLSFQYFSSGFSSSLALLPLVDDAPELEEGVSVTVPEVPLLPYDGGLVMVESVELPDVDEPVPVELPDESGTVIVEPVLSVPVVEPEALLPMLPEAPDDASLPVEVELSEAGALPVVLDVPDELSTPDELPYDGVVSVPPMEEPDALLPVVPDVPEELSTPDEVPVP